jgi:aspartate/methionine/tyrosine aminotransferase
MRIADFVLERYFARHEFSAPYLLCASDVEPVTLKEVEQLFDDECRALYDGLALGYVPPTGHVLLRREIAAMYQSEAEPGLSPISPDDVIVFTGAEEAIFVALNAILDRGDHAIVTWPGYQSLYEVAIAAGADVTRLVLEPAEGWTISLDRLRAAIRKETRLIVVNFPHNPTGALCDRSRCEALDAIA